MSNKSFGLPDAFHTYLLDVSLREHPLLTELRQETAQHPEARMQIAPEQGQFMALLARLMGAQRVLEVGVFTGYSSLAVALALPEDGTLTACDVSPEYTAIARRYWKRAHVASKIMLHLAPASETLGKLLNDGYANSFDFAFVDADKESYDTYYEQSLALLRPGGLLVLDNMFRSGRVADPAENDPGTVAIRTLNAKLHHDDRIDLSLLPVADGLTLALKR